MSKRILHELEDLVDADVIGTEQADRIRNYYHQNPEDASQRQRLIFGVIGSLLVGLGLILLIAHNWDSFSKLAKTAIAFAPLLVSQIIGFFILRKPGENKGFKEGISIFIFLSIGACLSLISQIYHIQGSVSEFLRTWLFLGVGLIYIFNSGASSILYLLLTTYYAVDSGYFHENNSWYYWLFIGLWVPYYLHLFRNRFNDNITSVLNWLLPISLTISLAITGDKREDMILWSYLLLFGVFYLFASHKKFKKLINNGWKVIGATGTIALLMATSFEWYWEEIARESSRTGSIFEHGELFAVTILLVLAIALLLRSTKTFEQIYKDPIRVMFAVFSLLFFFGTISETVLPLILVNVVILAVALIYILLGIRQNNLGVMNFGLLIFAVLVACRYFDLNLSFTQRGLLFVVVGCGFFISNIWVLRRRKELENE